MSQRLLVADLKDDNQFRAPTSLNICPEDPRFNVWLNLAEEALLNQGRWWGSIAEIQFCTDACSGQFAFPRQVAAIEQLAVNGTPVDIENQWYPFTRLLARLNHCPGCGINGTTAPLGGCGCDHLQYRSAQPRASFSRTNGDNKVIRSYCMAAADVGKKIVYQGYDKNGIWVRTTYGGSVQDGEQVTLAIPFVDTSTVWATGSPQAVIKDATIQRVPVYEYNTVAATERLLSTYEPGETRPWYRTGYIPHFRNGSSGCTTSDKPVTITALASLQHVPLVSDGDWCILQNAGAYKAAMMAMKKQEEGDVSGYEFYLYGTQAGASNARGARRLVNRGGAIPLLNAELEKMGGRVNGFVYLEETNKLVNQMGGFW